MNYKFLVEASGSITSGYLVKAIQSAGHICVASDIDSKCYGKYLADDFILMPKHDDPDFWQKIKDIIVKNKIDIVIPSLDETMMGWSERKGEFNQNYGVQVILSPPNTINVFDDKFLTYEFFCDNQIPTPLTSLKQEYPLIKPRFGRGSSGIFLSDKAVNMEGMISQEFIEGDEYTIDVLCNTANSPVYIIPRRRLKIANGKSIDGITELNQEIIDWVKIICNKVAFLGPINIQCFLLKNGDIKFLEVNPRIAGGMGLGFAASENWIPLIVDNFLNNKNISKSSLVDGMQMRRYYDEIFIPPD